MPRIVLGVEYDGQHFLGWQFQTVEKRTVQGVLESALSKIANEKIVVHCAGRTDTGVHAFEQVVHFDTNVNRQLHAWQLGTNSHLPNDVRVLWVKKAIDDFHARYSAIARFYRYMISNQSIKSAFTHHQTTWINFPLDAQKMHIAAQCLIGHHDFSSFRAHSCQSQSPFRQLYFIDVYRQDKNVIIDLSANAFLHHMVRNIVGALIAVGSGKRSIEWFSELLNLKNRTLADITAPPHGLYLAGIYYPEQFQIKPHSIFYKLPSNASRFD